MDETLLTPPVVLPIQKQSWVGFMLMNQPFYVGGIEDKDTAKGNAFGAAGLFFFIFLVSMVHLIMDSMQNGGGGAGSSSGGSASGRNSLGPSDSFDGWTGQRQQQQTSSEFGQVAPFQDYEDDTDGQAERVGFLS